MTHVVVPLLIALAVAGAVMVVAGGGSEGVRRFVADLRGGVHAARRREGTGVLAGARQEHADAADVDTGSVEDLFARASTDRDAYVQPEEIFGGLTRTTQRAVRGLAARR